MRNLKAQTTPGIMLGVGMIFFLFILVIIFTANRNIDLINREEFIEKRSECLKISNLINSVYSAGPGAQVQTKTNFLLTIYNSSLISIQDINSVNESSSPKIAFLASEAGPTTQNFYDEVNDKFDPDPDWYKACFSGIGSSSSCDSSGTTWMENLIQNNISDLMNNLSSYNTIYLEDPTIYYGHNYIQLLENWVSQGNALILSEHVMCRENSGSYSQTDYRCNHPNKTSDNWELFGTSLYQRGSAWGYPGNWNVIVVNSDPSINLGLGDLLSFEERPYNLNGELNPSTLYEAEDLILANGYVSSLGCACTSPSSGRCARHQGAQGTEGTITLESFSEPTGPYDITIKYCDESDDGGNPDDYNLSINNNVIHSWESSNGPGPGQNWIEETITSNISNGDDIVIGSICNIGTTFCRVDWIDIKPAGSSNPNNNFKTIATYRDISNLQDSRNQPAITTWDYGQGKIFYFGDFQVNYDAHPGLMFSDVLTDLIEIAYYLVYQPEKNSDVTCTFSAFSSYKQLSGDIIIKNEDNYLVIEDVNSP